MVLNDVLTKQNVITKILLKEGCKELPKELKVKIMRIRMIYSKIKKNFDEDLKQFSEELLSDEFKKLNNKSDKTEEENNKLSELLNSINSEYQEYLTQKGLEKISYIIDDDFTQEEYFEILEVNAGNNVDFNGKIIPAADFLEAFYELFVKEN